MKHKTIFFQDELNDEFSKAQIEPITIDKNYVYFKNTLFYRISAFFWYRIIALPIAWLYMKCKFRHKIVGKKKIKACKDGMFLFGNHTHHLADAVVPTLISLYKKVYLIVHPNNVSIKPLRKITPKLGAIPLPDDLDAVRNFKKCLSQRFKEKAVITIYPEAHIWPYYTAIRPFTELSFRYPVDFDSATYCFTNTYQKGKFFKHPKMVTYIDGPFYPDKTLSKKEAQQKLRNAVYQTMLTRAKSSNVIWINYIKEEKTDD